MQPATALGLPGLLAQLEGELHKFFFEREEEIDVLLTTLLAGENAFIPGEPGTGKSDLLETISKAIVSGKYARFLMDPFMGKEDIYGAHDIERYLAGGGWKRDTTDTAVDAHVILWDEIGRAVGGILASMLTLLNEKRYKDGKGWIPAPVIANFGASNSWLFDTMPAMADRFLVSIEFEYMKEEANVAKLFDRACDGINADLTTHIPLEMLQQAVLLDVPAVAVPQGVRQAVLQLKSDLRAEQIILSDRRWYKVWGLVKAAAYKAGRSTVDEDDLKILQHALFNHPDQRSVVRGKVLALTSPYTKAALQLGAQMDSIATEIDNRRRESIAERAGYGAQAAYDLGEIEKALDGLVAKASAEGRNPSALDEVRAQIDGLHEKINVDCMGFPPGTKRL